MIDRFFKGVLKYRWVVLLIWVVIAVGIVTGLPSLQEVTNRTDTSFLPKNSETLKAEKWINEINPTSKSKTSGVMVLSNPNGINEKDRAWFYDNLATIQKNMNTYTVSEVVSLANVPTLKPQFLSKDGELEMAQLKFKHDLMSERTADAVQEVRELFKKGAPDGTHAYLTGAAAITIDFKKSSDEGLKKTEFLTLILVLGILLLVFRSPITPFLPLVVVAFSFVITTGLVGWAADNFGLPISTFTQSFLIAIMFGAGTDYCILLLQRFREELANGLSKQDAILRTMHSVGKTVLYAGSTVLIAFSIIGFATLNMYASAVGVAIGIAVILLAAITLLPALFMLVGKKMFWPIKIKVGDGHHDSKLWLNMSRLTNKRPILVILIGLLLFMPLSIFFEGKRSFDDLAEIGNSYESVKGFRLIEQKFSAGEVLPTTVAIKSTDISLRDPQAMTAVAAISTEIAKIDSINKVRSISQPTGDKLPKMTAAQQQQMMQSPEFQMAVDYYTSQDGTYGKIDVILKKNPYGEKSLEEMDKIKAAINKAVKGTALEDANFRLAGTTAQYHELDGISHDDLIRTMTLVIIGTFLVLVVMLRSIVAPLYILISLVLNYLITMGIVEWVFVHWLGHPGLSWTVSFFAFIIIIALGVDYSIFLMARIKEEYIPGDIAGAIRKAMASTGGVIMSAAAIMSGTFAAFMFSGVLTLMEIGACIVIGLMLYTFLFMGLLVPATVRLLGDKNGWPFKF